MVMTTTITLELTQMTLLIEYMDLRGSKRIE